MSSTDPRYPRSPLLDRELERVGRAGLGASADLVQRWCTLGLQHAGRAGEGALAAWRQLPEPKDALHLWVSGARDYWQDMAGASAAAAQHFADALAPGAGGAPLTSTFEVDGKPVLLPARIRDASQAMAMWAVPVTAASEALATRLGDDAARFRVLDLGDGSTPFALFVVDYRESDLGAYHELGAAFFVRPAADPGATPGLFMVDLPVDHAFTCHAGRDIWGYPKVLRTIELDYGRDRLRCSLKPEGGGKPLLSVSFPRGGDGGSSEVPLATYTLRDGGPCLTVFSRSGSGERTRGCSAGSVTLEAGAGGDPLADMVRALRLPETTPMLHGWTEHMSGSFGYPQPLSRA